MLASMATKQDVSVRALLHHSSARRLRIRAVCLLLLLILMAGCNNSAYPSIEHYFTLVIPDCTIALISMHARFN